MTAMQVVAATTMVLGVCVDVAMAQPSIILDALAATVGPRVIRVSDVRLARELGLYADVGSDDEMLQRFIDRSLMLSEVDRFQPPDPSPTRVRELVQTLRARVGDPAWEGALRRAGVDEAYITAIVRDDQRIDLYVRQRFGALALLDEGQPESDQPPSDPEQTARFHELVKQWIDELRSRGEVLVRGLPGASE